MVTYSDALERRIAEVQKQLDELKALRPEPVYEPVVLPHPTNVCTPWPYEITSC